LSAQTETIVAAADPAAEEAAIRAAFGGGEPVAAEAAAIADEPFLAGYVPLPSQKPSIVQEQIEMASVAVPTPRPELDSAIAMDIPLPADKQQDSALVQQASLEAPATDILADVAPAPELEFVAAVPVPASKKGDRITATMRTAMLEEPTVALDTGVATTAKSAKPKAGNKKKRASIVTPPSPKSGTLAFENQPLNQMQPTAEVPALAYAAVTSAPTEVYVGGFSNDAPVATNKFSGKAVNFLKIAKFKK
jgi:hypothetical protein